MKKKLLASLLVSVVMLCAFVFSASAAATEISTVEEFMNLMSETSSMSGSYILKNDIDLTGVEGQSPIGTSAKKFSGTFDGNGFAVKGVNITTTADGTYDYGGLFGLVQKGTIKNLTVYGTITSGQTNAGGIAAWARGATIENCHNYATVTATAEVAGGILGYIDTNATNASTIPVTITNCTNHGSVNATAYAGGILGVTQETAKPNQTLSITGCKNYGDVTVNAGNVVGGIVGYYRNSSTTGASTFTIDSCANYGTILSTSTVTNKGNYAAGIIGAALVTNNKTPVTITLTNLYNEGYVEALNGSYEGGIAAVLRIPLTSTGADGNLTTTFVLHDWVNAGPATSIGGAIATFGSAGKAVYFDISNVSNNVGTKLFATQTALSGEVVLNTYNHVNLTNCVTSASTADEVSAFITACNGSMYLKNGKPAFEFATVLDETIDSAEELMILMYAKHEGHASTLAKNYKLGGNIDLSSLKVQQPIGSVSVPFTGTFDGQSNTISGINISGEDNVGLFAATKGATLKNLNLKGTVTATGQQIAALVGIAVAPITIENVTSDVTINASGAPHVGAIAGLIYFDSDDTSATISGCRNDADITAGKYAGGLFGIVGSKFSSITGLSAVACKNNNVYITDCENHGDVIADNGNVVGGVFGYYMLRNSDGTNIFSMNKCANYGTVNASNGYFAGGVIGALLEAGQYSAQYDLSELYNAGTVAVSKGGVGTIVSLVRNPKPDANGVTQVSIRDCWNVWSGNVSMVGSCDGAAALASAAWTAERLYNAGGAYIFALKNTTSGEVVVTADMTTTITLVDCFNNESDMATAVSTLVTDAEDCVWVERYDAPELKEYAQEEVQATLDSNIDSAEELVILMNSPERWAEDYTITAPIDLKGYTASPIGNEEFPYTGTFNGGDFAITGLEISGAKGTGLFGYAKDATFKNVVISGANISGTDSVAALVGLATGTLTIENCNVDAAVICTNARAAILVGDMLPSAGATISVSGCTTSGSVTATASTSGHVAGVFGRIYLNVENVTATITNCTNSASASAESTTQADTAGIIGRLAFISAGGSLTITDCTNSGNMNAPFAVGGIIGQATANMGYTLSISGCTNTGTITGTVRNIGGIIGYINNLYDANKGYYQLSLTFSGNTNNGIVNGVAQTGGLIGAAQFPSIKEATIIFRDSENHGTVNAKDRVGGAIGYFINNQSNSEITITNIKNYGAVDGGAKVGGLFGRFDFGGTAPAAGGEFNKTVSLSNLANYGDVTVDGSITTNAYKGRFVGGIIGFSSTTNTKYTVDNVYNEGDVTTTYGYVGGIIGNARNYGKAGDANNTATEPLIVITNAENRGNISSVSSVSTDPQGHVGGIAGFLTNQAPISISNSVNAGTVTGKATAHAIVGYLDETETVTHVIENCFFLNGTDARATAITSDTDFSALGSTIWTTPVNGLIYAPELAAHHDTVLITAQYNETQHSKTCWCGDASTTVYEAHTPDANGVCTVCGYGDCTHAAGAVEFSYDAERGAIIYTRTCCETELYVDTTINTTVYVDSTASDVAANATVEAAVDTFGTFDMAMEYAAVVANANGSATVVIKNTATVSAKYASPEYEGTITITGANGTETKGILYFGAAGDTRRYYANGNVTFENLSIKAFENTGVRVFAQNHTMVMGTGITMDNADSITVADGYPTMNGVKMYVHGGFEYDNSETMNTNLTVRSGEYWFIGGWNRSSAAYDNCGVGNLTIGAKNDTDKLYTKYIVGFSTGAQELTAASTVNITIDGKVDCHVFAPGTQNDLTEKYDVLYTTNLYLDGDMNAAATDTIKAFDVVAETKATNTALNIFVNCENEEALADFNFIKNDATLEERKTVVTVDHTANEYVWTKSGDNYEIKCPACQTVLKTQTEIPVVYVGDAGNNDADGFTAATKVKTLTEAVERIAATGGTVMFNGMTTISAHTTLADWGDNKILFTADPDTHDKYGAACSGIVIAKETVGLNLGGAAEFDAVLFKGKSSTVKLISINANWHDLDMGYIRVQNYATAYIVAGAYPATVSDSTEANIEINIDAPALSTNAGDFFYERVYLGSIFAKADISADNKTVTANFNDGFTNSKSTTRAQTLYIDSLYAMSTSANLSYATCQTNGCTSTVNLNGNTEVFGFRTGGSNVNHSTAKAKLDSFTVYLNDNSQIVDKSETSLGAFQIRNVVNAYIYVSDDDGVEDWDGEGNRTEPLIHSAIFTKAGDFANAESKVYARYGTHSFSSVLPNPIAEAANTTVDEVVTDNCAGNWNDGEIITEATDKTLGKKLFTCTVCSRTYTEIVCGTYAHMYVEKAPNLYVCEYCGDVSTTLVMPDNSVLITAKASDIVDGKVTVDIWVEADAMAATLFNVDAPDGFTLDSITDIEDSFHLAQPDSLTLPTNIMLINLDGEDVAVNGKVATLTFTVDPAVFTEDGSIVITAEESVNAAEETLYTATVNAEVSTALALSMNVKYGLSVILKGDFVLEFLVQTTENVDVDNSWIEIHGVEGNIKPYTYTEETADGVTTTTLRFYAPDIAAKNMNDAIYYDFHTVIDNVEYAGETTNRNIVNYYNLAKKTYGEYEGQGQVDSFLNLFYTMFNYGAAAQTYFGHNTGALVNEHLDAEDVSDYTDITYENQFEQEAVDGQTYTLAENSITLKQKVSTTLKFTASELSTDGISFKATYTNYEGTVIAIDIPAGDDRIYIDGDYLCVNVDSITPKDFREEFTGALYSGDTQVSATVTASVEAYAANILDGTNDEALTAAGENVENLKAVCRALLAYSDAAKDLFYKITVDEVK